MYLIYLASFAGLASALCPYSSSSAANKAACPYTRSRSDDSSMPPPKIRRAEAKQGVFLMNRIGPSSSTLFIANADGSDEQQLLSSDDAGFDYSAQFSPDGEWITFTSERNGDGGSDLYMVRSDGSDLQEVIVTPSFEGASALSPDGTQVAYVSTANGYITNIWVLDLSTGQARNLTNTPSTVGDASSPDGHFRPSWSPDGQWIAFSSDRNTAWTGHNNGAGWEHTQTLSIYAIRPNGSDFRQVVSTEYYCLGSPKWSHDGKRIVYYEIEREFTWNAHRPEDVDSTPSAIVSVDFETGTERIVHADGAGVKSFPQFVTNTTVGYLIKGAASASINYTTTDSAFQNITGSMRSPAWSPDGTKVVYEIQNWDVRAQDEVMYSWQEDWEYRFSDVFPDLSHSGSRLALTQKQTGPADGNIVTQNTDGSDLQVVFNTTGKTDQSLVDQGLAGAFQPDWSPDDQWIAFGLGWWFFDRALGPARIMRTTANGSFYEYLTDDSVNSGYPSYSPDGRYIVYRTYNTTFGGLHLIDLENNNTITQLTDGADNLPHFSSDGSLILFTRRTFIEGNSTNFDVCTMNADGSNVQVLTDSGANDAHAVWGPNNTILYSSGMYGFREECALYDQTFQPYGQIMSMEVDGSNKKMLTDSMWEDSMPQYLTNEQLGY